MDLVTSSSNPNSEANAAAHASGTTLKPALPALEAAESISVAALKNLVEDPEYRQQPRSFSPILIIDVRPYAQFAANHIRGAIQMTVEHSLLTRLERRCISVACLINERHRRIFTEAVKSSTIVLCDSGSRTLPSSLAIVAANLRAICQGVQFLDGGVCAFSKTCGSLMEATKACSLSLSLPKLCTSIITPPASPLAPVCQMARILPYLFLGSREDAHDRAALDANNIRYVLNITEDCPNVFEHDPAFHYRRIAIPDSCSQNISAYFQTAFEFINLAKANNSSVLVHCMAGISRSTTIVVAYLMNVNHGTMTKCYEDVKSKRPIVSPNLSFMGQLLAYEKDLSGPDADGFVPARSLFDASLSSVAGVTARS
eukprot:m.587957 g.587957  ORF g.587957 m.587957 type:complete len:371 (+) comp57994_c0_seq3:178-1290(+)